MINITVKRNSRRVRLDVTGHAGTAPLGQDIVCAAVSALVLTLVEALARAKAKVYRCDLHHGEAHLRFAYTRATKPIWETIYAGLDLTARSYPIQIKMTEETGK